MDLDAIRRDAEALILRYDESSSLDVQWSCGGCRREGMATAQIRLRHESTT